MIIPKINDRSILLVLSNPEFALLRQEIFGSALTPNALKVACSRIAVTFDD